MNDNAELRPVMLEVCSQGRWSLELRFGAGDDARDAMRKAAAAYRNSIQPPHSEDLVEKVARIISPKTWSVMDNYLKMAKRQYSKSNTAYDPEAFKDAASMKLARDILSAIEGEKP